MKASAAKWIGVPVVLGLVLATSTVYAERLQIVAEAWPPYVDNKLPGKGVAIELVTTAFERAGYEQRLVNDNWSRALEGARIGVYDVVANIWHTDERARDLSYSDPYLSNDIRLIKRRGRDVRFNRMDDLKGLLIGVVKDYAYPQAFTAAKLTRVSRDNVLSALGDLVKGQDDVVIGDKRAIEYAIENFLPNESQHLEFLPKSVGENKLYVAVSKANPKHEKITRDFNRALKAMKKDGTYQKILASHRFPTRQP